MKKILSIILVICMLVSLTSCGLIDKIFNKKKASSINGVSIKEYVIVCDADGLDYNKRAAEHIQATVLERSGVELKIVDDSEAESQHEIIVGETTRELSKALNAETKGFEFAINAKNGSIAMEGEYFVISAAAYYFTEYYVLEDGNDAVLADGVSVHEPITEKADNYILLIGDGMGLYQTLIYDYLEDVSDYSDGEDGFYGYMFPNQGFARTSSYSGITDSAAAGTALATGYKTNNRYIGVDKDGNELKSLTELASELGKATAVMSTETDGGATPSTFSAHTLDRDNTAEIRMDQLELTKNYGTVIECGFDYYNARYMEVIEQKITDTLATLEKDEDGFFIMYEEAHIDKKSSKNDLEATYLALIRFNQAIARFMEYAFYNPNTLVIITADHETGGLAPDGNGKLAYSTEEHTSADVPVFAWGDGSEFFNEKRVENIEISKYIAGLMGDENFGDQSGDWYDAIYGEKADDNTDNGNTDDNNNADNNGGSADNNDNGGNTGDNGNSSDNNGGNDSNGENTGDNGNSSDNNGGSDSNGENTGNNGDSSDNTGGDNNDGGIELPIIPIIPVNPSTPVYYEEGDKIGNLYMTTYDENGELTGVYNPKDNSGKVTVINFWGIWCPYCLVEMPYLDQLATELSDKVEIVALHTVDNTTETYEYIEENFADSSIIFGEDKATINGDVISEYFYETFSGIGYYPYTVFIDTHGEVYYIATGAMNYSQFKTLIELAYSN